MNKISITFWIFLGLICSSNCLANKSVFYKLTSQIKTSDTAKLIEINSAKIKMILDYANKADIVSLAVNGRKVISKANGVYSSIKVAGRSYSSLHLSAVPVLKKTGESVELSNIRYGDTKFSISEKWIFTQKSQGIQWKIIRRVSSPVKIEEENLPVFIFDSINTWEGAYQGYGGLAWFYLFNEPLCTYGVHTNSSSFWDSHTGDVLTISVNAPGRKVAMKYTRSSDNKLVYSTDITTKELIPRYDSGTNRRRFIRNKTDVWSSYTLDAGTTSQVINFSYADFNEKYGRGVFKGINGKEVNGVLNTIIRMGVIDSLHFGGNSWHTPYGPICLHEQYIADMGLAIDDPSYLNGYKSCLAYYCKNAIKPDGRVFSRWAYTNEDMMAGQGNRYGFYEAQWGILMDSNPDLVTNVSELFDLTGDSYWVKSLQPSCEKALDWIIARDSNHNGLVEMMTDSQLQKKSSDWIDIIWASYENAFVNAKLYLALTKWASIERILNNPTKANFYEKFAWKLKQSFNKSIHEGGFWDEENGCYVHWLDKDGTPHGRNMVTPVNFMAIAYGICDNKKREKMILDRIETQMNKEKLFFWPLCMTSYAKGEGNDWQFPFPAYENGDIFLSWGSVAVQAYANYKPEIALKYIKNILSQYSKDGLAFQRYGRLKQDGLGDDILSGNGLSIVGLYQSIYGVNPKYNRLYLQPHLPASLSGTKLRYQYRGKELQIGLTQDSFSISDTKFKVMAHHDFGYQSTDHQLSYFNGNSSTASLKIITNQSLALNILDWNSDKMQWIEYTTLHSGQKVNYQLQQLKPGVSYQLSINDKPVKWINSDENGNVKFFYSPKLSAEKMKISRIQRALSER